MDKMIEVRYAGAVVGRPVVRDVDPQGVFLGATEPMPVGTELVLNVGDDAIPGTVAAVSESQDLARAGMRVRFRDADEAALFGMALASAPAAPLPVAGSASAPTMVPPTASGRVAAAVASGRASAEPASGRVGAEAASGRVAAAAAPVSTGGFAAAEDDGEPEAVEPRSGAQVSPSGSERPSVPREPEISGPVSSGDGGGAGGGQAAGGGQGGGGRKDRRKRRR